VIAALLFKQITLRTTIDLAKPPPPTKSADEELPIPAGSR